MERSNYWTRRSNLSRRRFVGGAAAGTAGLAGVALVGCGDDDDAAKPATSTAVTGGTTAPGSSTTAAAETPKKGGSWNSALSTDIPTIDPYGSPSANTKTSASYVYSRLFEFQSGKPDANGAVSLKPVGDVADSFTVSSDGLKYTIKLKPNAKWHPPVNRTLTADDVVYSWQRLTGNLPGGKPFANADRLANVAKVEAADERTVVFTLSSVYGPFIELLADATTLYLMPKETGTAFDPALQMVGSGPYMFDKYVPGSALSLKRNPNWHGGPDRPYLDSVTVNIVKDAATRLNQFLAGNLDTTGINGLDIANVKQKIPTVQFVRQDFSGLVGMIGFREVTNKRANAPWTDIRVRRALSMALDRDALLDVAYNVDKYAAVGVNVQKNWQGLLPAAFGDIVVDPKSDANISRWFKYDPKAAKALLDEAGGGFSVEIHYEDIAPEGVTIAQVAQKYWSDIGVKGTLMLDDYASKFIPQTYRGNFEGIAFIGQAGIPNAGSFLASGFTKAAVLNFSKVDDPKVEESLGKYNVESDEAKRKQLLMDLQKYLLGQMYYVPSQWGAFTGLTGFQPNVRGATDHASFGYGAVGQNVSYYWKA